MDDLGWRHLGQSVSQGLVAVEGDIFFDIFSVNSAAVSQSHALLLLVKANVSKKGCRFRVLHVPIEQALDHAALEKVLTD